MTLRDDMVIAPNLGPQKVPAAPVRARVERRLAAARRRHGLFHRLRQARHLRRRPHIRRARSGSRMLNFARRGALGAVRGAALRLGARAAIGNPIGLVITALIVAGVVALRLGTGQPLEGLGEELNSKFLGEMDDEARAKMTTRQQLGGDSDIARIVGQEGRANSQIARLGSDLFDINKRNEIGASEIRRAFPANNIFDMLILRARDAFLAAWNGNDGAAKAGKLAKRLSALGTGGKRATGGR